MLQRKYTVSVQAADFQKLEKANLMLYIYKTFYEGKLQGMDSKTGSHRGTSVDARADTQQCPFGGHHFATSVEHAILRPEMRASFR